MKRSILIAFSVLIFSALVGQDMTEATLDSPIYTSKTKPKSLSEYFKENIVDWNVGNLHVYPKTKENSTKDYYFEGVSFENKYYRLLPTKLQNNVIRGSKFFAVSAIKGKDLGDDFYILREQKPDESAAIFLAEIRNNRFKVLKKIGAYSTKGNTIQRTDSWIKDLDRDGRFDIVRRKVVLNESGKVLKEKYTTYILNAEGKMKKTNKLKIDPMSYQVVD